MRSSNIHWRPRLTILFGGLIKVAVCIDLTRSSQATAVIKLHGDHKSNPFSLVHEAAQFPHNSPRQ